MPAQKDGGRGAAKPKAKVRPKSSVGAAITNAGKTKPAGKWMAPQRPSQQKSANAGVGGKSTGKVKVKKKQGAGTLADSVLSGKAAAPVLAATGRFLHAHEKDITKGLAATHIPGVSAAASIFPKKTGKVAANAANDLVDIPASIVPSLYNPAKHLAQGEVATAANDVLGGYKELVKHPGKTVEQHPLGSALMVLGAEGAIGRGAGGAMRSGALGKTAKDLAKTDAPHRTQVVPGTPHADRKPYSKNVIHKAVAVTSEKARNVNRDPGHRRVMSSHGQRVRANEQVAKAEDVRRVEIPVAVKKGKRAAATGGHEPTAHTVLATQGIVNFTVRDLKAYRAQIAKRIAEIKDDPTHTHDVASHKANLALINRAIEKPGDMGKLRAASEAYAEFNRGQQKQLEDLDVTGKGQAHRASQIAYAVSRMGAKKTKADGLVDPHGHPLTEADIRAHMASHGSLADPAFVSHTPNMRRPANFYVKPIDPGSRVATNRTGLAAARGTADVHPAVLEHQTAKAQGLIVQAREYADFIKNNAIRAKNRTVPSTFSHSTDAQRAGQAYTKATGVPVRAVRLTPFHAGKDRLDQMIQDSTLPEHAVAQHVTELVSKAIGTRENPPEGGPGQWVLVPEQIAKTVADHNGKGTGTMGRVGNVAGTVWRKNVLAFSPKWLVGNVGEAGLRTVVRGATPMDYAFGRRYLAALEKHDPQLAMEARARMVPGGHYSLANRSNVHTDAQHFADAPDFLRRTAQEAGRVRRMPVGKQGYAAWKWWTDNVFAINGMVESQFQTAMLGKGLRELGFTNRRFLDVSHKAAEAAMQGAKDVNAYVELGRFVDRAYGKYGKYGPDMRRAIATWTPFVPWTLNAIRFLGSVLPKDHPIMVGLIASANIASEDWRKAHGQKLDAFGKGGVPSYLAGGIPGEGDSVLRLSRYTPMGIMASEGGPLGSLAGNFAPQIMELIYNAQGLDWRKKSLDKSGNQSLARNTEAFFTSLLESAIPFSQQASTLAGVKLPNQADNAKMPETLGGRARKQFDPFMFTQGGAQKPKATVIRQKTGGWGKGNGGGSTAGWGQQSSPTASGWGKK